MASCLLLLAVLAALSCHRVAAQTRTFDLEVTIPEEQRPGTFVANISDQEALFRNISVDERKSLVFGLLDGDRLPASLFSLGATTGELRLQGRLDREAVCDVMPTCHLDLDVAVHSTRTSFSNVATVRVSVEDINDNDPAFPARQVLLSVSEGARVGTVLKISGAADRDSLPLHRIQRYLLVGARGRFSLSDTTNLDGSSTINLRLEVPLDRERESSYEFEIQAEDGGTPPRRGSLGVQVTVTDENDNPPVFTQPAYSAQIREDAALQATLLTVTARDLDAGDNGRVTYRFSGLLAQRLRQLFAIGPDSGIITLTGSLQTLGGTSEQLVVEAVDGGQPSLRSQTVVNVTVLDTGNSPPLVRLATLASTSPGVVQVSEEAGIGAFLAHVEVSDSDSGANGQVSCVTDNPAFALSAVAGKGYKVLVNAALDRERQPAYTVVVTCTDNGSPALSASDVLQVTVQDANDEDPVFLQPRYLASVPENNDKGTFIVQVRATDNDEGDNARLTYSLDPAALPFFNINPEQGIVTAATAFNRESRPSYVFVVTARDAGDPPRSGTATVSVNIDDDNDSRPKFTRHVYSMRVLENRNASSTIGQLSATDDDEGDNAAMEFSLESAFQDDPVPFFVLSNGTVVASPGLDREEKPFYNFTVRVTDKGASPLHSTAEVMVTVEDENDNRPQLLFPTSANETVVITAYPDSGTAVGKVVADDRDAGNNSTLRFALLPARGDETQRQGKTQSEDRDEVFDIDQVTGVVRVRRNWLLRNQHVYELHVRVRDQGPVPLEVQARLLVEVNFDNSSRASQETDASQRYLLIASTVAGATIVLSIVIIAAIIFVLRMDRRKTGGRRETVFDNVHTTQAPGKLGQAVVLKGHGEAPDITADAYTKPPAPLDPLNPLGPPSKPVGGGPGDGGPRKKEVSFSLDDSADSGFRPSRDLTFSQPYHAYTDDSTKILHLDDVHSDSSGETGTSDSGRGGSEEDVNCSPAPDQGGRPPYMWQQGGMAPARRSLPRMPPPKPARAALVGSHSRPGGAELPPGCREHCSSPPFHVNPLPLPERTRDPRGPMMTALPARRRQSMEDDGTSTTTSGSYTLHPDDHFDGLPMPRDVIV